MSDSSSRSQSRQAEVKRKVTSKDNGEDDADKQSVEDALAEMERLVMEDDYDSESATSSRAASAQVKSSAEASGEQQMVNQSSRSRSSRLSPAEDLQPTTKSDAQSPSPKPFSVKDGENSVSAETPRKSVGFSRKPEVIEGDEQSARGEKDESPLVVARGKRITMQRSGDMMASDESSDEEDDAEINENEYHTSNVDSPSYATKSSPVNSRENSENESDLSVPPSNSRESRAMSAALNKDERTNLRRRRVMSAQLRRTQPPPETIDNEDIVDHEYDDSTNLPEPKSSYAVSDEEKRQLEEKQSREKNRKMTKKQREEEEKRRKRQENQEIFDSWVAEKRKQKAYEAEAERRRQERLRERAERIKLEKKRQAEMELEERRREHDEKLRARKEKEEKERMRFETSEAYQKWWAAKRKQLERDRRLEEERYKDLNELRGIRTPSEERQHRKECERAFREWKMKKAMQEQQEREKIRENTRMTRLISKHLARCQELEAAFRSNTSTRFTDYYGYRF